MKSLFIRVSLLVLLLSQSAQATPALDPDTYAGNSEEIGWGFLENLGQWEDNGLFRVHASGFSVKFERSGVYFMSSRESDSNRIENDRREEEEENTEAVMELEVPGEERDEYEFYVWKMKFGGGHPRPELEKGKQIAARTNFFRGKDPQQWQTKVPEYDGLVYREVWKGIDVRFFLTSEGALKYEFVLAPGADPDQILIEFEGLNGIEVLPTGELKLNHPWGPVIEDVPYAFTETDQQDVPVQYVARDHHSYGFLVPEKPKGETWVIDPLILHWSSFTNASGPGSNYSFDVGHDAGGNLYMTGPTTSTFPPTTGAFQTSWGGDITDAYVAKFSPDGSSLVFMTYLGGISEESGQGIEIGSNGNVFITGESSSSDFPLSAGAISSYSGFSFSPWVACLSPDGALLVYSTFLCTGCFGNSVAIAPVSNGEAIVAGITSSSVSSLVTTPGAFQSAIQGSIDGFVCRINATGTGMVWSTYLGGSGQEILYDLSVNDLEEPYVVGGTFSNDFPVTPGAYQTGPVGSSFVTRLNATGTGLVYSTYMGQQNSGLILTALDVHPGSGEAFVGGSTTTGAVVATPGALQPMVAGSFDGYIARINAAGNALVYATFLGGSLQDEINGIAVNSQSEVYVSGVTASTDFPTSSCQLQTVHGGAADAFFAHLGPMGDVVGSGGVAFFGGNLADYENPRIEIAEGPLGDTVYCSLTSHSPDFPTTPGTFQPIKPNGNADCQVAFKLLPFEPTLPDTFFCGMDSVEISVPGQASNVLWSTGDTTPTVWIHQSGTYWVTGLIYNCPWSDTFEITLNHLSLSLGPDTTICETGPFSLNLNAGVGTSWLWSTNATSPSITVTQPGIYWVSVTDSATGCLETDTIEIQQSLPPVLNLPASATICSGNSVILDGDPTNQYPGANYLWSNGITTQQSAISTSGWAWVDLTTADGCTSRDSSFIVVNPLPSLDIGPDTSICDSGSIVLDAGGGFVSYLWSTNATNPSIIFAQSGLVWVEITDANGCTNRDSILIRRGTPPQPDLGRDTSLCEGKSLTLIPLGNGLGYSFDWSNGETAAGITVNQSGMYSVVATELSSGCTGGDSILISLLSRPVPVLPSDTLICDRGFFVLNPGNFSTYDWSGGSDMPTLTVSEAGSYAITVTDVNGCEGHTEARVRFNSTPAPDLGPDLELCVEERYSLSIPRTPGHVIRWSEGSAGASMLVNESGTYWVEVNNECGRRSDTIQVVFLRENSGPFMPNAFTPNSHIEDNTTVRAIGEQVDGFRLTLYDRWGKLIFHSNIIQDGWGGTIDGKPAAEGVYVYVMQFRACDGKLVTRRGTVTLLR